jgi:ABC-type nickel/cobalt efflux system permease component RcnA
MWYRRAVFTTQFAATIVLPLWLLIGRVFFGVILGWHYAIGLFLAPLLFTFLAVVTTITWARKGARRSGAVSRIDAWLLSGWYFAVLAYGFFVVDSVYSYEPGTSIATHLFGQPFRDASFTIADISGGVIIILAFTTLWVVLIEYLVETRREVVTRLTGLDYDELQRRLDATEGTAGRPGGLVPTDVAE